MTSSSPVNHGHHHQQFYTPTYYSGSPNSPYTSALMTYNSSGATASPYHTHGQSFYSSSVPTNHTPNTNNSNSAITTTTTNSTNNGPFSVPSSMIPVIEKSDLTITMYTSGNSGATNPLVGLGLMDPTGGQSRSHNQVVHSLGLEDTLGQTDGSSSGIHSAGSSNNNNSSSGSNGTTVENNNSSPTPPNGHHHQQMYHMQPPHHHHLNHLKAEQEVKYRESSDNNSSSGATGVNDSVGVWRPY